ncbi:hypothetical protein [Mycobacterium montefiorense]|uniref:Uncharacterized protein n=1 Tax=Mycobacterium montefiorense TaxID=154654 RepID=A0AA37PM80_9MYCO|nr:hypothetical protein [Mycobacterium montefiorense]GBG37000.1 hypothetical protein MmonteBS_13720 [Mycobacterium montefiorense]GKU32862.1 hypothetical protein NJB14191_02090 [Mycobacterium montefiorense]GKU42539.1 hypothetical protein NJB14192_45220 [Mycobacterium montefiorense]GKU48304.1 hypothetical protein NJB14194_49190 [Mycobacterium montefiorense]GKU50805.1 hypothetical protein NJB14195_20510 [Mycobacterium montefiorense]
MGSGDQNVEISTGASRGTGAVDDIVHGALYLEIISFVTGEILHIDGGMSAGH